MRNFVILSVSHLTRGMLWVQFYEFGIEVRLRWSAWHGYQWCVCVCVCVKLATHYNISHDTKHSYNEFLEHSSRGNQSFRYEPAEQFRSLESFASAWLDKENSVNIPRSISQLCDIIYTWTKSTYIDTACFETTSKPSRERGLCLIFYAYCNQCHKKHPF